METVIIVSHISPVPPVQGNRQVIQRLISYLRRHGFRVIYVLQSRQIDEKHHNELRILCDEVYVIGELPLYDPKAVRRPKQCWNETIETVKNLAIKGNAVAVISEYLYMTPCFEPLGGDILKFVHTHDMMSRVKEEVGSRGLDTQGREMLPLDEREALLRSDVIIALSAVEKRLFEELVPERKVILIPGIGYKDDEFHCHANPPERGRILMVGADNPMNREGLYYFCSKALPRIKKYCPDAKFYVAGGVSNVLPDRSSGVFALGIIQDLDDEYVKASVVVNPVSCGTGLKIKTIEALRYGKAVVSTPAGVEGMPGKGNEFSLVAKDWDEFSDDVILVLKDDELRKSFEVKSFDYIGRHFHEDTVYRSLMDLLQNARVNEPAIL